MSKRGNIIKVLMSDDELSRLRAMAGDVPLSAWCRKRLLSSRAVYVETNPERVNEIGAKRAIEPDVRGERPKKNKWANRYCPGHHVMGCEVCE